jgi:hypothetical protein
MRQLLAAAGRRHPGDYGAQPIHASCGQERPAGIVKIHSVASVGHHYFMPAISKYRENRICGDAYNCFLIDDTGTPQIASANVWRGKSSTLQSSQNAKVHRRNLGAAPWSVLYHQWMLFSSTISKSLWLSL